MDDMGEQRSQRQLLKLTHRMWGPTPKLPLTVTSM